MYSNKKVTNLFLRWMFGFLLLPCAPFFAVMAQNQYTIRTDNVTVLYADKYTSTTGSISVQNQGATWNGTSSMRWTISVATAGNYKFKLLNTVSGNANGTSMQISSQSGTTLNFTLRTTSGLLNGYERDTVAGTLALPQGVQWIQLASVNVASGASVMGLRGLEMNPVATDSTIAAEYARAKAYRASTDWMVQAKYGCMHHWTTMSINESGSTVPYQQMVSGFNVSNFANQEKAMGVGYVLFTVAHVATTFPAPLTMWEKYHPGMTTQRDLVMEMADSLNARGIKLMLYFPPQFAWPNPNTTANFMTESRDLLTEIGNRYGKKVAGYWFDGFYQNTESYPDANFDSLDQYCKAGNPDRVIALNSWIYPSVSPWQEYSAGEAAGLVTPPSSRYLPDVSNYGEQAHLLSILEPNWWMDQLGRTPSYSAQQIESYVLGCMKNGVVPTINTMIYVDGTILPASLAIFEALKQAVANVNPVVSIRTEASPSAAPRSVLNDDNFQILGDKILFPSKYAGKEIMYSIFDITGKRLRNSSTSKLTVNLRQESKLRDGHYIVQIVSVR
jgi:Alpha-L-fucosidase